MVLVEALIRMGNAFRGAYNQLTARVENGRFGGLAHFKSSALSSQI